MGYAPDENEVDEEYENYSEYQEVDGGDLTEMEYTTKLDKQGVQQIEDIVQKLHDIFSIK